MAGPEKRWEHFLDQRITRKNSDRSWAVWPPSTFDPHLSEKLSRPINVLIEGAIGTDSHMKSRREISGALLAADRPRFFARRRAETPRFEGAAMYTKQQPIPASSLVPSRADLRHLNQEQLARRWSISPRTLERWRWLRQGPRYLKIGGRVVYRLNDIEVYENSQAHAPAALPPGASAAAIQA
jgi:hypothetical protein